MTIKIETVEIGLGDRAYDLIRFPVYRYGDGFFTPRALSAKSLIPATHYGDIVAVRKAIDELHYEVDIDTVDITIPSFTKEQRKEIRTMINEELSKHLKGLD